MLGVVAGASHEASSAAGGGAVGGFDAPMEGCCAGCAAGACPASMSQSSSPPPGFVCGFAWPAKKVVGFCACFGGTDIGAANPVARAGVFDEPISQFWSSIAGGTLAFATPDEKLADTAGALAKGAVDAVDAGATEGVWSVASASQSSVPAAGGGAARCAPALEKEGRPPNVGAGPKVGCVGKVVLIAPGCPIEVPLPLDDKFS